MELRRQILWQRQTDAKIGVGDVSVCAQIKRKTPPKAIQPTAFARFGCREVAYHLDIPIGSFNTKVFFKTLGVKTLERWSASLLPSSHASRYHVHFKGSLDSKAAHLTIEYCAGGKKTAGPEEQEPFAESIMPWLGKIVRATNWRSQTMVRFNKPTATWRSRFNLPFKVTMSDSEVVIDGVSLVLPRNPYHATSGFVARDEDMLFVSLQVIRSLEFAKFDISEEIASFDQALRIFIEEVAT
jgi:hypothetical protein